jgi:LysM repeat protein
MASKQEKKQDEVVEKEEPAESSLTDLLHGLQNRNKETGQARFKRIPSPVLIAVLFLSVVLSAAIYRIGIQGTRLRNDVEQLTQENRKLAWTLESIQEEVYTAGQEVHESTAPSESTPGTTPEQVASTTQQRQSEAPPSSTSTIGKPTKERKYAAPRLPNKRKILYRVKKGDSLSRISEKFGVSVGQICAWNNMETTDPLLAKQVLTINSTMTTDSLQYVTKIGAAHKADLPANRSRAATGPRGGTSSLLAEQALEKVSQAMALAELQTELDSQQQEHERTVARLEQEARKREELEEKLATSYISKESALVQIGQATAEAEARNQALSEMQAKLESQRQEHQKTVARLEGEVQKRSALEERFAANYTSNQSALEQIAKASNEVETANKALAALQAELESQRQEYQKTVAMLEQEARKREKLEEKLATSYISKESALVQISQATARTETARQALAELQAELDSQRREHQKAMAMLEQEAQKREALEEKLATNYISKESALAEISQATAEAEARNQGFSEMQAKLESQRQEHQKAMAMLEQEAQKRKALEEKLAINYISRLSAFEQISQARTQAAAGSQALSELRAELVSLRKEQQKTVAMLEQEVQKREALEQELSTNYISKQAALVQLSRAGAQAETANQALAELQARLDSQRKEHQKTVARLEQEEKSRKSLEQQTAIERQASSWHEGKKKTIARKPPSRREASESTATEDQERMTGKSGNETVHFIREGENLFRIGVKYDVSWKTLVKYNNLANANAIYVGQKIKIPLPEK